MRHRTGLVSNFWIITGLSAAAFAVLAVLLWSPWDRPAVGGGRITFFFAAGMTRPVEEITQEYRQSFDTEFESMPGGSGQLLPAIEKWNGDSGLYLAADSADMEKARRRGLVAEVIPVAVVRPVLAVNPRTQEKLKAAGRPLQSLRDLLRADLRVILADPEGTAIGQLTRKQLEAIGAWTELEKGLAGAAGRVSTTDTVNEVAKTLQVRDDHVGVVWTAVARHFGLVAIEVPEFKDVTEQVQVGVLARSTNPTAALRFARFLSAKNKGGEFFQKHHFDTPADADTWEWNKDLRTDAELFIDAGAMLEPALKDGFAAFESREGIRITPTYMGCGLLVSKMKATRQGEDRRHFPDVYVSCDVSFHNQVRDWFETAQVVLENDMVIIVPRGNPKNVQSLNDLTRPDLRVGLPDPHNSALGNLIDNLLKQLGLHDRIKPAEYSDAAHTLVYQLRVGALDVAVVGRSNALSAPQSAENLDVIDIKVAGALAVQTFAASKDSRHKQLTRRLFDALFTGPDAASRVQAVGFRYVYGRRDGNRDPGSTPR
jgi:molybdate transport system substrate-binding protein